MCLIPFPFMKSENSCEVNCEALSLTSCCGMPCRANMSQSFSIVASLVMLEIIRPLSISNDYQQRSGTFFPSMALRNRCELSAMGSSANPMGAKVPVGACFVT